MKSLLDILRTFQLTWLRSSHFFGKIGIIRDQWSIWTAIINLILYTLCLISIINYNNQQMSMISLNIIHNITSIHIAVPKCHLQGIQYIYMPLYFSSMKIVLALKHTAIWYDIITKTKYMVMSRDQNTGRNHNVRIDNSTFEWVEEFKYLRTTLTNQILFSKKLRADCGQGMLAIIRCRIFCVSGCYPKI